MSLKSVSSLLSSSSDKGRSRRLIAILCAGVIVLAVLIASVTSLALAANIFTDVPATHIYHSAIEDLAARRIINGYGNGNFGPGDPVTRQQFAKMAVLTGGYPVSEANVCYFTDVIKGGAATFYPDNYVAVCAANGITTGKTATTFDPHRNISRYQVITMVVRMTDNLRPGLLATIPAGWSGASGWGNDPTHSANARRAEYNSLLAGLNLASLNPYGNMSRGEVAQVLCNLLGKLAPSSSTTTTTTTTTTTSTSSTTTTTSSTTTTTSVPTGSPIATYSGSGDDVIDVQKPAGPALVWVSGNAGSDYFGVKSYGPGYDGPYTYYDLLVNTAQPYEGIVLIDYWYLGQEELTTRLVVTATGPWSIEIRPLNTARTVGTPGQIQGTGDEVILVTGNPDTAHITGNADSGYFGVKAYYGQTTIYDLLVNTADPYDGTVMFTKPNAALIEISADGLWSISTQP